MPRRRRDPDATDPFELDFSGEKRKARLREFLAIYADRVTGSHRKSRERLRECWAKAAAEGWHVGRLETEEWSCIDWEAIARQLGERDGHALSKYSEEEMLVLLRESFVQADIAVRGDSQEPPAHPPVEAALNSRSAQRDGPAPPSWLWHKAKPYVLPPQTWRIVSVLWGKDQVRESDFCLAVWGDEIVNGNTLRSAVSKANRALLEKEIGLEITRSGGFVSLA